MVYLSLSGPCAYETYASNAPYLNGCIITVTIYIIQPFEIFRLGRAGLVHSRTRRTPLH